MFLRLLLKMQWDISKWDFMPLEKKSLRKWCEYGSILEVVIICMELKFLFNCYRKITASSRNPGVTCFLWFLFLTSFYLMNSCLLWILVFLTIVLKSTSWNCKEIIYFNSWKGENCLLLRGSCMRDVWQGWEWHFVVWGLPEQLSLWDTAAFTSPHGTGSVLTLWVWK